MSRWAAILLVGCFSPEVPDNSFRCAEDEPQCPSGQTCCDDNLCRSSCEGEDAGADMGPDGDTDAGKGEPDINGTARPTGKLCDDDTRKALGGNNTFIDAQELVGGSPYGPYNICWSDDVDYYLFPLEKGTRMDITVDFLHGEGDLDAVLMGPDQGILDVAQGTSDDEYLAVDEPVPEDGDYRIVVYGYAGATNEYSLIVTVF